IAELSGKIHGCSCSRDEDPLRRQNERIARAASPPWSSHLAWTAPMNTTDLRTDVTFGRAENTPWWAVAFAALLLAVSFRQRQAGETTGRAGEETDRTGD